MEPLDSEDISDEGPKNNCTIFLGYTSNMASCGVRENIRFLVYCSHWKAQKKF